MKPGLRNTLGVAVLIVACGGPLEEDIQPETEVPTEVGGSQDDLSRLCAPSQTFVTNTELYFVGLGAIVNPETKGSCLETSEWMLMKRDASRLLSVEAISEEQDPDSVASPSPQLGDDYYIKNRTRSLRNVRIDTFQCKNFSYSYSQTCSVSMSGSISQNVNLSVTASYGVVSGTLGYSVTWGTTKTYSSSTTIGARRCIEYRFFSQYYYDTFELWEDDVFSDDYIGKYTTRQFLKTWVGQYDCVL